MQQAIVAAAARCINYKYVIEKKSEFKIKLELATLKRKQKNREPKNERLNGCNGDGDFLPFQQQPSQFYQYA